MMQSDLVISAILTAAIPAIVVFVVWRLQFFAHLLDVCFGHTVQSSETINITAGAARVFATRRGNRNVVVVRLWYGLQLKYFTLLPVDAKQLAEALLTSSNALKET